MWYDKVAKKLYTIGLDSGGSLKEIRSRAFLISSYLYELRQHTGDDLCLDSAAVGNQTLQLISLLVALFAMRLAIARL